METIQERFRNEVARTGSFYDCIEEVRALDEEARRDVLRQTHCYAVVDGDGIVTGELVDPNFPATFRNGYWYAVDLHYAEEADPTAFDGSIHFGS